MSHTGPVRLIATDVDGTVVTAVRGVTEATAAAFRAARARGASVALVTGRPLRWLTDVVADLGGVDGVVVANGAVVYRLPTTQLDGTQQLLDLRTIAPADVCDWAARLRAAVPGLSFGLERVTGFGAEPGYDLVGAPSGVTVDTLAALLAADPRVLKMIAKLPAAAASATDMSTDIATDMSTGDEPLPGDRLLSTAREVLRGLVDPVHSNSRHALIELGPPGVDKATGLAVLAQALGIARQDVTAFGDMPNDVPMLRWAGRGYAMADGHPDAIAAADAVARPCDEDGVALVVSGLAAERAAGSAAGEPTAESLMTETGA